MVPEAKALEWVETWKSASTSLQNRSEMLANVAEVVETNMTLLGRFFYCGFELYAAYN